MHAQYEIYRIDADGSRTFCDDALTYQFAELNVQQIARTKPGRYAIVDQLTGEATVMNLETPMQFPEEKQP